MEKFAYEILFSQETPQGPVWIQASNNVNRGPNLFALLNQLGQIGWEVVGLGDVGATGRVEIILKKRL